MFRRLKILLVVIGVSTSIAHAEAPSYFTNDIDSEYRALINHVGELLPETQLALAYLPSFTPYSLLDVRPLKFEENKDKQAFANFNFGVFGRSLLNVTENQLSTLPSISICKEKKCKSERLQVIDGFLAEAKSHLKLFNKNDELFIVQQTSPQVYRLNNTFYSPTALITYYPSEHAGFVPSSNFEVVTNFENVPELMFLANESQALRGLMGKYEVAAIAKIDEVSTNIIFNGLSDNHWGVVIDHYSKFPAKGDSNHIGLEYDIVEKLSDTNFYYQTN
ncbi:hypothetical protein [Shewanella atlantica]|uniref:hypothetical protein n=1 Tax=Shewanella atlantica TaxID=271099 RepID=UPI001FE54AE8|nr:hypothetical protein [Shewanella atlantica]